MSLIMLWLLCVSSFVLKSSNSQDILIESSAVKCTDSGGDNEVVHWRPEPLQFSEDGSPLLIAPHEIDSSLSEQLHNDNDINIKLVKKCSKKLKVTLKITDSSQEMTSDALVIVERAQNEITGRTSKIGNPIAIKIHQSSTLQLYPFKFLYKVNGKVYEEVLHRDNTKDFNGCDDNKLSKNPTCGFAKNGTGDTIQAGFCCSCDDQKDHRQTRGGQQCDTPGINEFLKTSAHCLRFSPFWYGVYEIHEPELFHQVQIQVYKSQEAENGSFTWSKETETGQAEMVSPQRPNYIGDKISISYRQGVSGIPEDLQFLNVTNSRLLIPIILPKGSYTTPDPAPLKGSLGDIILVVPKAILAPRGAHCDRVGTSHQAFLHQDHPCRLASNSCLLNQPFDLWEQDQGRDGDVSSRFKLSSFGPIFETLPIKMDGDKEGKILMEHKRTGAAYIDIDISADELLILSPGYNPIIAHVMTDSGSTGAKVIAQIGNRQYVESAFAVNIIKCSGGLPDLKAEMKTLGPLGSETFRLDMHFAENIKLNFNATCVLVVVNEYSEAVAARQILLSPADTCICLDACACTCVKESLKCEPLSRENQLAAGVVVMGTSVDGTVSTNNVFQTASLSRFYSVLSLLTVPIILLLFLGFLKGVLGLCCHPVGSFGLSYFSRDEFMKKSDQFCFNLIFFLASPCLLVKCCRGKSSNSPSPSKQESTSSFPEGDKKYFSIVDDDTSTEPQKSPSEGINTGGHGQASSTTSEISSQGFSLPETNDTTTDNEPSSVRASRSTSATSRGGLSTSARRFGSWHRSPTYFNSDIRLSSSSSSLFEVKRPNPHEIDF